VLKHRNKKAFSLPLGFFMLIIVLGLSEACTPKSPDIAPADARRLDVADTFEYVNSTAEKILRAVKKAYDLGEVSEETRKKFLVAGEKVENGLHVASSAYRTYLLAVNTNGELSEAEKFQATMDSLSRLLLELQSLAAKQNVEYN
jgi:hypothetical protein